MSRVDIISQFSKYDINNISDYVVNQLKKYVDDPNFTPDYVGKISEVFAAFCGMIRAIYQYAIIKEQVSFEASIRIKKKLAFINFNDTHR